jgi:hypothetical protein
VADCVPILSARRDGKLVAAVHAGWRGVVGGIVSAAIEEMRRWEHGKMGGSEFSAAIGPCIGPDAFEVGPNVLAEFRRAFGERAPLREAGGGKGFVDLPQAVQMQLLDTGLAADQIDLCDRCTFRDREEFFSHRREDGLTGRMAAVISIGA